MDSFLPTGYEAPKTSGNYFRFVKGENRFRILGPAIVGYSYWTKANKPVRSRTPFKGIPEDAKLNDEGDFRPKHFWAFVVWNYEEERPQIMEITQSTIMSGIEALVNNAKWGAPQGYDIVVKASGDGMEREYTVVPEPHTRVPEADISGIAIEELFNGADPFKGASGASETPNEPTEDPLDPKNIPF